MKLLLDECLPVDLRHSFPEHEAHTADWAGLKGLKNGELLMSAEAGGYDVLVTVDHGIPHQQNLKDRKIAILVIAAATNQMEDLLPQVAALKDALKSILPGQTLIVRG